MSVRQNCVQMQRQLELLEQDAVVNREEGEGVIQMNDEIIARLKEENNSLRSKALYMARTFTTAIDPARVQRENFAMAREIDNLAHKRRTLEKQLAAVQDKEPTLTNEYLDTVSPVGRSVRREPEYVSCVEKGRVRKNPNTVDLTSNETLRELEKRRAEIQMKLKDARSLNELYTRLRRELVEQSAIYDKQVRQCKEVLSENEDGCYRMGVITEEAILAASEMDRLYQEEQVHHATTREDRRRKLEQRREEARATMTSPMTKPATEEHPQTRLADDTTVVSDEETIGAYCRRAFIGRVLAETGVQKCDRFVFVAQHQASEHDRLKELMDTLQAHDTQAKEMLDEYNRDLTDTTYSLESAQTTLNGRVSGLREEIEQEKQAFDKLKERNEGLERTLNNVKSGLAMILTKMALVRTPTLDDIQTKSAFRRLDDKIRSLVHMFCTTDTTEVSPALCLGEGDFQNVFRGIITLIMKLALCKELQIRAGDEDADDLVSLDSSVPAMSQGPEEGGIEAANLYGTASVVDHEGNTAAEYFDNILGEKEKPCPGGTSTKGHLFELTKGNLIGHPVEALTMDNITTADLFDDSSDDYTTEILREDCSNSNVRIDLPISRQSSKAPLASRGGTKTGTRGERVRRVPQVLKEKDPMDRTAIKKASEAIMAQHASQKDDDQEKQ